MDIIEAIRSRKSIRMYKPDPVPKKILREILEIASRAPSVYNTQPWEITVITGKALDNIKQGRLEEFLKARERSQGETSTPRKPFEGKYRERQVALGKQLYNLLGIAREDTGKRAEWMQTTYCFKSAPAAFIVSYDKSLDGTALSLLDIGGIMQNICLAALNYGLGTCLTLMGESEVVRKFTGIPESKRMVLTITIGHPDWDHPANKLETTREPVESFVTWCDDA